MKWINPTPVDVIRMEVRGEWYIVLCDEAHRLDAMRVLGRWAANPELAIGWEEVGAICARLKTLSSSPSTDR